MLTLAALAGAAFAADADVQALRPATPGGDLLWTETSSVADGLQARAVLQHSRDQLVLETNGERQAIVGGLTRMDLLGGWGFGRAQLGLGVPLLLRATSDVAEPESGLGDLSLDARVSILERDAGPVGLGAVARLSLPTATVDAPLGASGPALDLLAAADAALGPATVRANLGLRAAADAEVTGQRPPSGTALLLGAGASMPVGTDWGLTGELASAPLLGEADQPNRFPAELLLGGWRDLDHGWRLQAGAGAGISPGVGAPRWRAFLSVSRRPDPGPAPIDPTLDTDGDTVFDVVDVCPLEDETVNGIRDADGCPEDPAVLAAEAEAGADLALEFEGDTDGDGIVDLDDACPERAEDLDGIADGDGCPEDDADADGIADKLDACPLAAETRNGVDDADGCPEAIEASVAEVSGVVRGVTFATGSDRLRPESTKVLRQLLTVLTDNPTWTARVEGHTDDVGDREGNLALSARRAVAVQDWLVARGVDAERITTEGLGPDRPLTTNDTDEGRAENRRVEVHYSSKRAAPPAAPESP